MEHKFYVYEHLRADSGAIFYVGKGQGARARQSSRGSRSEYWQNIVAKAGGFTVRFVARDMDQELSLLVEMERINQLRRRGVTLCNLTDGGDGARGYKRRPEMFDFFSRLHKGKTLSAETRAKISASVKAAGFKHSPEVIEKIRRTHTGNSYALGRKVPEEERLRRGAALKGKRTRLGTTHSAKTRLQMSKAKSGVPQPKLQCTHCQKIGGNAMRRWHFENCRERP